LKDRHIRILVTNGDISVEGIVKDEQERRRINELAMSIAGVKSIANALRIAE
jgi:osmotically-inducible protein OsmY